MGRGAIGNFRDVAQARLVEVGDERLEETLACRARFAVVEPWTWSHASTKGPINHGHTGPW
jgi:hypothetical protein